MESFVATLLAAVSAAISLGTLLGVILRWKTILRWKQEQAAPAEPPAAAPEAIQREISALSVRIDGLESLAAQGLGQTAQGAPIKRSINLTKRTQALRQYRLGQGPNAISKSLDMPKAEVDLLLKIQQIVAR